MEVVYKSDAVEFKNTKDCSVYEYSMKDCDINGAVVKISGRYPDNGCVKNLKCKEMAYVLKGKGTIVINEKRIFLAEGDLILIHPEENYFWEGELELFVPSTPAWNIDQHKKVL